MMQPVLSAAAQREADRLAMEDFGLPALTLMETAGRAIAHAVATQLSDVRGRHIGIVAGKGNNGGDGCVAARVLHALGARVGVFLAGRADEMTPDAAHNFKLLRAVADHAPEGTLVIHPLHRVKGMRVDLFVDALLGTGLARPLRPAFADVVDYLGAQPAPVVSADLPTGLHADTGKVMGRAVRASATVTLGSLKPGLLLGEGPRYAGDVTCADIGIPHHVTKAVQRHFGPVWRTTDAGVRDLVPLRAGDAHKYSAGKLVVLGGSPGLTGAAVLASQAAARAGAGYVVCATHACVQPILSAKLTAVATAALAEREPGDLAPEASLSGPLRGARALLVGPGLGRGAGTRAFARRTLCETTLPAVVDADGLNSFAGRQEAIRQYAQGRWILTPHAGELARLAEGVNLSDRIASTRMLAEAWNVVLVAKGMPSLVAVPGGDVFIAGAGSRALATAGTGDVLAGLCAGLLAQGASPTSAAIAGIHTGGRCAEYYARDRAAQSMTAMDMVDALPHVLQGLTGTSSV